MHSVSQHWPQRLSPVALLICGLMIVPSASALDSTTLASAALLGTNEAAQKQQMNLALQAGRTRNFERMAALLEPLVRTGHADASYRLASLYRSGKVSAPLSSTESSSESSTDTNPDDTNIRLAAQLAMQAAEQGHPRALALLASLCQKGRRCEDSVKALLQQAAEGGFEPAKQRLAELAKKGHRLEKDEFLIWVSRGELKALEQQPLEHPYWQALNDQGQTPLMIAVQHRQRELALWMLERLTQKQLRLQQQDQNGQTALTLALHSDAVMALSLVPELLAKGAQPNVANQGGDTPLLLAVRLATRLNANTHQMILESGDESFSLDAQAMLKVIEALLASGAEPNVLNLEQQSPWSLSLRSGLDRAFAQAIQQRLQAAGAVAEDQGYQSPVRTMLAEDETGLYKDWPELAIAAWQGETERVASLIERGDPLNATGPDGLTALARASWRGHQSVIERLMKAGAKVSIQDKRGRNALMWTLFGKSANPGKQIRLLLTSHDAGLALNQLDQEGNSLLHQAVSPLLSDRSDVSLVRQLVAAGVDLKARNLQGQTALMVAVANRNPPVVASLLQFGATIDDVDDNGRSLLWYAADAFLDSGIRIGSKNEVGVADESEWSSANQRAEQQLGLLLSKLTDVHLLMPGSQGQSLRELEGPWPMARCLMKQSAVCLQAMLARAQSLSAQTLDIDQNTEDGNSLLTLAAGSGQFAVVERLLELGADINRRNLEGNSALMLAARQGDTRMVELLLERGANPMPRNQQKLDAAGLAEQGGHPTLANLIRKRAGEQNPLWMILGG